MSLCWISQHSCFTERLHSLIHPEYQSVNVIVSESPGHNHNQNLAALATIEFWPPLFCPLVCSQVRHSSSQNYREHHVGHLLATVHVCCDRSATVQGNALCKKSGLICESVSSTMSAFVALCAVLMCKIVCVPFRELWRILWIILTFFLAFINLLLEEYSYC